VTQEERDKLQRENADLRRQVQAEQQEKTQLQRERTALQQRHEMEMEQMRQGVEREIREWQNATEQRDRTIGDRDALLQQWMEIANRQREIAGREEAELERERKKRDIFVKRAKKRRRVLQQIPNAVIESLDLPERMSLGDLFRKDGEYSGDGEIEGFRSAPPELANEEAEPVQMSAPPERIVDGFMPEEIRAMAEAIRGKFIAAAKGQSVEARRNLGSKAMEALEDLFKASRARGMEGRARAIIDGERRIIEANME
jgi:hypothetical protein